MEAVSSENYEQQERFQKLVTGFQDTFGSNPEIVIRVPGRVNLIGEHIDYCGYAVHPMAIDQDILIAAAKTTDSKIHLANINPRYPTQIIDLNSFGESIEVDKDGNNWFNYFLCGLKGVVEEISGGVRPTGLQCLFCGTIPPASGLSSSSALVVSSALVSLWSVGLHGRISRSDLANLCARSERFIGTQGGGMDQAIEMLAVKGTAKLIEFNPLTATDVKLPQGATFVIANSLAEINKAAGPEFNTRVAETRVAAKVLAKLTLTNDDEKWRTIKKFKDLGPDLFGLLQVAKDQLHPEPYTREEVCALLGISSDELATECLTENTKDLEEFQLFKRTVHVFSEALRVYQFKSVCDESATMATVEETAASLKRLGQLMFDSHHSCSQLYECSHPQLDQLVDLSRKHGALGARLTGAGWGGCIVALVPTTSVEDFISGLMREYYSNRPAAEGKDQAEFIFPTKPGHGAQMFKV